MTDEALSALLDGECSAAELDRLLEQLERDPALRDQYSRLCLARDSRQGVRARSFDPAFAGRVLAALDGRPAGKVVSLRRSLGPVFTRPWAPMAGFAAAAAVAGIAVIAVQPGGVPPPGADIPAAIAEAPAGADARDILDVSYRSWDQLNADNVRQLNTYFMTYSQSRAQQGMGGALGYARYAASPADDANAPRPPERDTRK